MKILIFIISLVFAAAATTAVYHTTQGSDINYYKAHRYFEKGRYARAIPLYEKSLESQPDHLDALSELAYSNQWTKSHEKAIEYFKRYLCLKPSDAKIKRSLAETFVWTQRWDEASALLEELIKDDPSDIDAKILFAESFEYSGRTDEAAKLYEELLNDKTVLRDAKKEARIRELLGETYMINKDYAAAIAGYEKTLSAKEDDVKTRAALADILSWTGQYDRSVAEFDKALETEPTNTEIKKKLATVLTWNKDYGRAEALLTEILRTDPSDTEVAAKIAEMLVWQKRYKEAIAYLDTIPGGKEDVNTALVYGEAYLYSGDYKKAKEIFNKILSKEPGNAEAKVFLADAYAYSKDFLLAIALYREALEARKDREAERKLADVLSWAKRYGEAFAIYDGLLDEADDPVIRLQKARVLGWAKKHDESLKEYKNILDRKYDDVVAMEMNAKAAYWKGRVRGAIKDYSALIKKEPENTEAMFDLSQVYSYQQMWNEAIETYNLILSESPTHFRAAEGLEKALLISERLLWNTGYDYIEQDSNARDMDIRKYMLVNKLSYPITTHIRLDVDEKTVLREFSDFNDVFESDTKIKLTYVENPLGWVDGFYNPVAYNRQISAIHTFGGSANLRFCDLGVMTFSYERDRLENTSKVIIDHYYMDNFIGKLKLDVSDRLKLSADFLYSEYSDNNERYEPGFDILYFFSLDPLRLSLKYRYFYKEYVETVREYWSPKGYTRNDFEVNWRHYLNKEEIYFGADDLYYDLLYNVSIDSQNVATHKFGAELNWDINKKMNFNVKGSFSKSSYKIYKDALFTAGMKYYF